MTSPVATPATMNAAALLATALAEAGAPTIVVCADVTALHRKIRPSGSATCSLRV